MSATGCLEGDRLTPQPSFPALPAAQYFVAVCCWQEKVNQVSKEAQGIKARLEKLEKDNHKALQQPVYPPPPLFLPPLTIQTFRKSGSSEGIHPPPETTESLDA